MITKRFIARALEKILFYILVAISIAIVSFVAYCIAAVVIKTGVMPFLQAFGILIMISIISITIAILWGKLEKWIQDNRG